MKKQYKVIAHTPREKFESVLIDDYEYDYLFYNLRNLENFFYDRKRIRFPSKRGF